TISPARESIIAKLVSSSIAMVYNFTLSRKWTFKSTGQKKREQFIKFSSLTVFNYILSSLILGGIVYIIHSIAPSVENEHSLILNDSNLSTILSIGFKPITLIQIIANLVVIIVFAVWNYYLYKKWIFKD
ncbi:MAG TPA: GtrA family protein, partial [Candidatus Dojkabacteria bacterium]